MFINKTNIKKKDLEYILLLYHDNDSKIAKLYKT